MRSSGGEALRAVLTCMRGLGQPFPHAQFPWHRPVFALRIPTMPLHTLAGVNAAPLPSSEGFTEAGAEPQCLHGHPMPHLQTMPCGPAQQQLRGGGALRRLQAIAGSPELYPELIRLGGLPHILALLSHDNSDIAASAIQLLRELTDADAIEDSVRIRLASCCWDTSRLPSAGGPQPPVARPPTACCPESHSQELLLWGVIGVSQGCSGRLGITLGVCAAGVLLWAWPSAAPVSSA